jgi:hypothetical protein
MRTINPLPVQFNSLLHGQEGYVFFSGHLNLRTCQYVWVRLAWQATFKSSTFWYIRAGKGLTCWCNIFVTITLTPKLINLVQLEVFIHIISNPFTTCGNMYASFMVVVVNAAVALVITMGRHAWHYARSIYLTWCYLTPVWFLHIGCRCVNYTVCVLNPKG